MKVGLIVVAAGLAAGAFGPAARANLLLDPSFETPSATTADQELPPGQGTTTATLPWYDLINYTGAGNTGATAFISSDIPAYSTTTDRLNGGTAPAPTTKNNAHTGDQYVYGYTVGLTSGTVGGVGQLVSGINAGDSYVGSAYFFDKDNGGTGADGDRLHSSGTAPSSADSVRMVWENASGTVISTSVSTATLAGSATSATAPGPTENQWVQLTTGTVSAPIGATQVIFELADTRGTSGGVMFGDDADLEDTTGQAVPEPASLGLIVTGGMMLARRRAKR